MSVQQNNLQSSSQAAIDSIYSDLDVNVTSPKIPRVPAETVSKLDHKKYYDPKVVSIGPYHYGKPNLKLVEKLKPVITRRLFPRDKEALQRLYVRLGDMVQELRKFYDVNSISKYSDEEFTKMMLLDSCFILYFIRSFFAVEDSDIIKADCEFLLERLQSNELFLVEVDLLLLENQIPFKVLREVINLMHVESFQNSIDNFMDEGTIFTSDQSPKSGKWLMSILCFRYWWKEQNVVLSDFKTYPADHLLDLFHRFHTKTVKDPRKGHHSHAIRKFNFRNVDELVDLGIHFKPSGAMSFGYIKYHKHRWGFSAAVRLPPIEVDDSTKPKLLNLAAYEMCSRDDYEWVTSYICLLDSLIDKPEDVKLLRKAWVLENYLGSDEEVAKLFNGIGTDLVPNGKAYLEAKQGIQRHYESRISRLFSQLKHEYFKSPWAFFALLGALIALFLSAVQTYYTIWSPEGTCDDLCMFLKMNHHL